MDWLYAILSAAFGLVVGSFLNVVIYRLPVKGKFFEKSRSYCPKCGAELKWYHNIPVFSYVFLNDLKRKRFCTYYIPSQKQHQKNKFLKKNCYY